MCVIVLSIIFNIIPIVVLPLFYTNIPNSIPAFVDLRGSTIVAMEKSYISIFRLPVMGVLLSFICLMMFKADLENEQKKLNKIIWPVIAFIGALKMGITSLEILFYAEMNIITYFRTAVFVLSVIGVVVLLYALVRMYKNKITFTEYKNEIIKNKAMIIALVSLYIITALAPLLGSEIK
ncbi:MAG: hypothetical protein LBD07_00475 [Spirochaetaceae bacterium]|jgi:hypothetical protein|nr:hypothetical protein [Spirochaetaceae bacterium]